MMTVGEYAQHMQQLHTCISRLMEGIYTQTFFTHSFHICLTTNVPTSVSLITLTHTLHNTTSCHATPPIEANKDSKVGDEGEGNGDGATEVGVELKSMAKETEVEDKDEGNDAGSEAKCNTTTEGELDEVGVNNGKAQYCGIFPPKGL